jgi:hypothetical protein
VPLHRESEHCRQRVLDPFPSSTDYLLAALSVKGSLHRPKSRRCGFGATTFADEEGLSLPAAVRPQARILAGRNQGRKGNDAARPRGKLRLGA